MKPLHTLTSTSVALAMFICLIGVPGLSQSQVIYDDNYVDPIYDYVPYNDPFYDEYGYDGYGYYDDFGYDYDDYILTDFELRRRIKLDLAMSPFVDAETVRVSVDNGIATLSGSVEDRSAMVDAVEIAYDAGAWKVRNNLMRREMGERPWAGMNDAELKEDIRDELASSPFVNEDQISVSVKNGVATLYGGVENKGEIADAVENAYEAGAKRVKSRLWVDPDLS